MSARVAARIAWGLAGLSLMLLVSGQALGLSVTSRDAGGGIIVEGVILALVVVFSVVGTLIVSRHPRNPIGWIFCGVAVATGLATLAGGYAEYWFVGSGGSKWLGETAAWYASYSWIPFVLVPATFVLLLFPDGRLLSRRWRVVAWCAGLGIASLVLTSALAEGPLDDLPQVINPYGVIGRPALEPFEALSALLLLVGIAGSALSLILRFRRAGREQRQQIKWLAMAGAVSGVTVVVGTASYEFLSDSLVNAAIMLSVLGLPLAAGVAILRYRLYDIDVVINRTLVYGALTASLAATYLGSVLLLQLALSGLTEDSGLAVAASTLAVAALFRPARRRIQAAVDRRFYRRKYDAARTLERFGTRLRDEVDLDALGSELSGVVAETMQPASVSLWLRAPKGHR